MKKAKRWIPAVLLFAFVIGGTGYYFHNRYIRGKALEYHQNKQPTKSSPQNSQNGAAGGSPAVNNQGQSEVLPIQGKFEHLSKTQERIVREWGNKVYKIALEHPQEIVLNGNTGRKAVSLTFDDGPDGTITPQILDLLKAEGIHATFCYVGTQMQFFPEVVKRTVAEKNLIINHTFDHPRLDRLQQADMHREISQDDDLIYKLTGYEPRSMRPPYGEINASLVKEMQKERKIIVLWSLDSLDWANDDAQTVAANVLDNVRPGDIILMHSLSDRTNTLTALPLIIKGLREKGYDMVRVDELIDRRLQMDKKQ